MEIHNSDVILVLNLRDRHGLPLRANDCKRFKIRVWTNNPNCHLVYYKSDLITDHPHVDRLSIPAEDMKTLDNGVVCYSYVYEKEGERDHCDHFDHFDHFDNRNTVVTDIYWRNTNLNNVPNNPIGFKHLEVLKDMLEHERVVRQQQIDEIRNYVEVEYTNALGDEVERSQAADAQQDEQIAANTEAIAAEVQRATAEEGRIDAAIAELNTNLDLANDTIAAEVNRAQAEESRLTSDLAAEVLRARNEEGRIELKIDNEVSRATTATSSIADAVENEKSRAKAEEQTLRNSIDAVASQVAANVTAIANETSRSTAMDATTNSKIDAEIGRATAEEARIESLVNIASGDIATEAARAKQVEADITTQLTTAKTTLLTTKTETESNTSAIATINGGDSVVGSIAHGVKDAKHYTDDQLLAAQTAFDITLQGYATKSELTTAVNNLVNGAPATLDTLKEIADALASNDGVVATITSQIGTKANAADVYTKTEIDAKDNVIATNLTNEISRARGEEGRIEVIASQARTKATANEGNIASLTTQQAANTTAIGVINGDENVIGSIAHAVKDSKHYTDDKITETRLSIPTKVSDLQNDLEFVKVTETSVIKDHNNAVIGELWIDNSMLDDTIEVYTKSQCDARFALKGSAGGDVDLSNYYTKAEVDAMFANIPTFWRGTQAEFDAIAEKDNNTIYMVVE